MFLANGGAMSENFYFKEWMNAWNSYDVEELLSFYHEDVFYRDPVISRGLKGKETFRTYLEKFLTETPGWVWEFQQYYKTKDDRYFVKWKATVHIEGRLVVEEGLDIIEFYDQRIILHEMYFDKSKIITHEVRINP